MLSTVLFRRHPSVENFRSGHASSIEGQRRAPFCRGGADKGGVTFRDWFNSLLLLCRRKKHTTEPIEIKAIFCDAGAKMLHRVLFMIRWKHDAKRRHSADRVSKHNLRAGAATMLSSGRRWLLAHIALDRGPGVVVRVCLLCDWLVPVAARVSVPRRTYLVRLLYALSPPLAASPLSSPLLRLSPPLLRLSFVCRLHPKMTDER